MYIIQYSVVHVNGRLRMGAKFTLWNPQTHNRFPPAFREMVRTLLLCRRRQGCLLSLVDDSVIFWVLNMCRWDWPPEAHKAIPAVRGPVKASGRRFRRYMGYGADHEPEDYESGPASERYSCALTYRAVP